MLPSPFQPPQVFKVDASENRTLQERYGFKSVPMFLMFYQVGGGGT